MLCAMNVRCHARPSVVTKSIIRSPAPVALSADKRRHIEFTSHSRAKKRTNTEQFVPGDAMLAKYNMLSSFCLSVCLSQVGVYG